MGPHLELLPRLLVDVGAAEDRVPLDPGGDRDRPANPCVGPLGVFDDLLGGGVQGPVVVGLHPNSNPIAVHSPVPALAVSAQYGVRKPLFAMMSEGKTLPFLRLMSIGGGEKISAAGGVSRVAG